MAERSGPPGVGRGITPEFVSESEEKMGSLAGKRTVKKVHSPALEKSEEAAIEQVSQGPIASGMGSMERGRSKERHVEQREKRTSSDVHTDKAREKSLPLVPAYAQTPLQSESLSLVILPQRAAEGAVDVSARVDHASDVVFSHYEIPAEAFQVFSEYLNSEGENRARLEKTLQSYLPTYCGESIEKVLHQFVEHKLGMHNFQLEPISLGLSGALVFKVVDIEDGSTSFFIKAFKESPEILAREVVSLNVLRQLPLRTSSCPHPMGVGKAVIGGSNYTFFAQTVAVGKPVSSLMSLVGSQREGSAERQEAMRNLEVAVRHVGRSLAELWSVHVDQARSVGPKVREEYLEELRFTTHDIEEVSRGISAEDMAFLQKELDLQAIKNAAEFLSERLSSHPELFGVPGYEHTDTNPENLFFDVAKDHLTLIDTEGVLKSVDRDGSPIGFPIRDKIGFGENNLPNYGFRKGLTEHEVRALISVFHESYNEAISPTEKERGPLCSSDALDMMMLAKHSGATLSIFLKLKERKESPERLRRHLAYEAQEIKAMVAKIEASRIV